MDNNYTHITFVVDRSGSMMSLAQDMSGGLNSLLEKQKKVDGKCTVSLYQFDSEYEVVCEMVDINEFKEYRLVPRGATALLDSVGKAINATGSKLSYLKEDDRPGKVLFVTITDGEENSSKEFTKARIKQMVEHQKNVYNWQFVDLGVGIDTYSESHDYGTSVGSKLNVDRSAKGASNMFNSLNEKFSQYRGMSAQNYVSSVQSGEFFNDSDRNNQK